MVVAHLKLELGANLGVAPLQCREHRAIEPESMDLAACAHGGSSRPALEQGHLAEAVSRPELVQRDLLVVLTQLDDPGGARDQDVERVRRFAFPHDHGAERIGHRHEAVLDESPRVAGQVPQQGQRRECLTASLDARRAHASGRDRPTPPRPPGRARRCVRAPRSLGPRPTGRACRAPRSASTRVPPAPARSASPHGLP